MEQAYCMHCKKLNCEKATLVLKSGFVVVDKKTGEVNSKGEMFHVAFHLDEL